MDKNNMLLGTGIGANYVEQLNALIEKDGEETQLFRAMCEAEYVSILENDGKFAEYNFAMEQKWFAMCVEDVNKWGKLFYQEAAYTILEITVLNESLKYMFYSSRLDNIGPAYLADIELLNKIMRRFRLL